MGMTADGLRRFTIAGGFDHTVRNVAVPTPGAGPVLPATAVVSRTNLSAA